MIVMDMLYKGSDKEWKERELYYKVKGEQK